MTDAWTKAVEAMYDLQRDAWFDGVDAVSMDAALRAALASLEAEGWRLVPVKPTEAMCSAGEDSEGGSSSETWIDGSYTPENVERLYSDMLAAAPRLPGTEDARAAALSKLIEIDGEML